LTGSTRLDDVLRVHDLTDHLTLLGVSAASAQIYRSLLDNGSASLSELAAAHLTSEASIQEALTDLIETGLVGRMGASGDRFAPVSPEAGLKILIARRESEVNAAMVATLNAYADFRRSRLSPSTDNLVEVVTGPAMLERVEQAERNIRHEVRRLDSPPYYMPSTGNETELDHLAQGIRYRVVYSQSSLEQDGYLDGNVLPCIKAGEHARVLHDVPVKLSVVDDTMALVSLPIGEADTNRSLLLVRPASGLFSALVGLFELAWQAALPIMPTGEAGPRLEPIEQRLLALLSAGVADETIIRTLRISRRTFFRYLERLQARAGVNSRFQLGVQAVRTGWLVDDGAH
jgi:DNA-binding CsgD family transcriptional regulator/sugar-specific transcriptional regulator TrmB